MNQAKSDKLNVGCGTCFPDGWINADNSWHLRLQKVPGLKSVLIRIGLLPSQYAQIKWDRRAIYLDISKRLPFEDQSLGAIYASHVLEHLFIDQVESFLVECHRILKPHGHIRIIVPDLDQTIDQYRAECGQGREVEANRTFLSNLHTIPNPKERVPKWIRLFRGPFDKNLHKWVYNPATMKHLLNRVGFQQIQECQYGESSIPSIETIDQAERFNGAFCLEATKA